MSHPVRIVRFAALAAVSAAALAACSTPSHTAASAANGPADTTAVAAANAFLAPYRATAAQWHGPTSSPPVAKNKTIVFLDRFTFDQENTDAINTARQVAAALGWKFISVDVSKDFNAGVTQALELHPDGLLSQVTESDADSQALAQIAAAKVPHVEFTVGTTDLNVHNPGIAHIIDFHYPQQGQIVAAEAVVATGGHARLGLLHTEPNSSNQQEIQGIKDYFAQHGGGTVAANQQVANSLMGTPQMGQAAVAFVQGHPDVNVVWDEFDGVALNAVPAIRAAGLAAKDPEISNEGDAPNLDFIRTDGGQIADVAEPYSWAVYASFDALNRIFNGVPVPEDDGIPLGLLTKDNLPAEGQRYDGGYDYASKYKALWGVN